MGRNQARLGIKKMVVVHYHEVEAFASFGSDLDQLESNKIQEISNIENFWYLFLEFTFPGLILIVLQNDKINKMQETGALFTHLSLTH